DEFIANREADVEAEREAMLDDVERYLGEIGASLDNSDEEIRAAIDGASAAQLQYAQSARPEDISAGPDGRTMLFANMAANWRVHAERILKGQGINETRRVLRENFVLAAMRGIKGGISIAPKV